MYFIILGGPITAVDVKEHCLKNKVAACSNSIRAETKPHLSFCDVELQDRRGTFLHGPLNNLIKHNLKKNA
jgi:hypothetical protein